MFYGIFIQIILVGMNIQYKLYITIVTEVETKRTNNHYELKTFTAPIGVCVEYVHL